MAEFSYPFDVDPDTLDPQEVFEESFSKLLLRAVGDGTDANDLTGSISGTDINIQPGFALCRGYGYINDTVATIPIPLNAHASFSRGDRIFLRLNKTANTVRLHHVQGTPGPGDAEDPVNPFGHLQFPLGPIPTQTEDVWDVYLFYILVPPNESAAYTLLDERSFNIVSPTGYRSGMHARAYEDVFTDGQQSFIRGINFWPHWRTSISQGYSELLMEGPRRHVRKSSNSTLNNDTVWRNVTGWSTVEESRQSSGLHLQFTGGGLQVKYPGFYEVSVNLSLLGGNEGRRSVRLMNTTTGERLARFDSHDVGTNQVNTVSLYTERYIRRDHILQVEYSGTGGSDTTIRASENDTFWLTRYRSSGTVIDDA